MDAPQIQYAQTEDEVNIAYWTLGEFEPRLPLQRASRLAVSTGLLTLDSDSPPRPCFPQTPGIRYHRGAVNDHRSGARFGLFGLGLDIVHAAKTAFGVGGSFV